MNKGIKSLYSLGTLQGERKELIATYRGLFRFPARHVIDAHRDDHPIAQELAQPRTDEDADNHIYVEVHGQEHGDVGAGKGHRMNHGAGQLLEGGCAKGHGGARLAPSLGESAVRGLALELARQEIVVLSTNAPTEFHQHHQQHSANTGGSEHPIVFDLPSGGQKTGINGVEVEEHLVPDELSPFWEFRLGTYRDLTLAVAPHVHVHALHCESLKGLVALWCRV